MTERQTPPQTETLFTHSELAEPTFWLALESNHKLCCYYVRVAGLPAS